MGSQKTLNNMSDMRDSSATTGSRRHETRGRKRESINFLIDPRRRPPAGDQVISSGNCMR